MELKDFSNYSKNLGGIKIVPIDQNTYQVSEWFINHNESCELIVVPSKLITKSCKYYSINRQILYDVAILNINSENDRPKCKYCGNPLRFDNLYEGYRKTDGGNCRSLRIQETMKSPEFSEFCKQRALDQWSDANYKNLQSKSHKDWASKPENRQSMSDIAKSIWNDPEYRKKQTESHRKWISEHPEAIFGGTVSGYVDCSKNTQGKLRFDSSWERDFIRFCMEQDDILEISRTGLLLEYEFENKLFFYNPDFLVNYNNQLYMVEVKADWLVTDPRTVKKLEAGRQYVEETSELSKYILISKDELYSDPSCKVINVKKLIELFN